MLVRALTLSALLSLAACAAAIPGYTPTSGQPELVKPMRSGEVDGSGVYRMSGQEKRTDCRHLRGGIMVTISRLRHRKDEVPTSALAVGANRANSAILGGSTKGLDREAGYARDRARIAAYNRHLAARGCDTVDIEAELRRPS